VRQIIDGTAYDTETAELIKQVWWDDMEQETDILYRTRQGAFFFYGRYLETWKDPDDRERECWAMKERNVPCDDERARKWLEKYANELVEQYFGEMPEGGSAERRFTLRMPNNLARRVETKAGEMPLARFINRCLERCVAEERDVHAMALPEVPEKIMKRSHQRSGVVADGTPLSSGARQATVAFTPATFHKLKLAADKKGMSLSEMVRQCVDIALSGQPTAPA